MGRRRVDNVLEKKFIPFFDYLHAHGTTKMRAAPATSFTEDFEVVYIRLPGGKWTRSPGRGTGGCSDHRRRQTDAEALVRLGLLTSEEVEEWVVHRDVVYKEKRRRRSVESLKREAALLGFRVVEPREGNGEESPTPPFECEACDDKGFVFIQIQEGDELRTVPCSGTKDKPCPVSGDVSMLYRCAMIDTSNVRVKEVQDGEGDEH